MTKSRPPPDDLLTLERYSVLVLREHVNQWGDYFEIAPQLVGTDFVERVSSGVMVGEVISRILQGRNRRNSSFVHGS